MTNFKVPKTQMASIFETCVSSLKWCYKAVSLLARHGPKERLQGLNFPESEKVINNGNYKKGKIPFFDLSSKYILLDQSINSIQKINTARRFTEKEELGPDMVHTHVMSNRDCFSHLVRQLMWMAGLGNGLMNQFPYFND